MANVYSGNSGDVVLLHPLDSEDGDTVGPGAWTLKNTASITSANAKFGSNLSAQVAGDRLDSDVAVAGFDDSDGKKVIFHLFWTTTDLTVVKTMIEISDSAFTVDRTRIAFTASQVLVDWRRKTDLGGPTTAFLRIVGVAGIIQTNITHSLVGFIDSGSATQGKIFIDGIDRTSSIINSGLFAAIPGTTQHARLGNHFNGLDPVRFMDHPAIIQSDSLSDAFVSTVAPLYHLVRGLGYRPAIDSVEADPNNPAKILIKGTGFGPDAVVSLNDIIAPNVVVFGDDTISVTVPLGVSGNTIKIQVTNVASNVTVTESTLPIPVNTALKKNLWTENGLSNRLVKAGDDITPEMNVRAGDPLPIYHPRIRPTVWTETAPLL